MTLLRAVHAMSLVGVLAGAAQADPTDALLQDGAYEVKVRLELPNAVNSAAAKTTTICVANAEGTGDRPLPVLSDNNPLAACPAKNVRREGAILSFDIECAGRDGARARAVYTLTPRRFEGRIAMVMGGKNMTMTEVQAGRRIGSCDPASAAQR
jgi:hypothetical protein